MKNVFLWGICINYSSCRFWRALRSFDQTDRAKFLQFVTGSSKVPLQVWAHISTLSFPKWQSEKHPQSYFLQGFGTLEGMNGAQKFQIHRDDRWKNAQKLCWRIKYVFILTFIRSTDRLPAAHTCFNQLDLPAYEVRILDNQSFLTWCWSSVCRPMTSCAPTCWRLFRSAQRALGSPKWPSKVIFVRVIQW